MVNIRKSLINVVTRQQAKDADACHTRQTQAWTKRYVAKFRCS